MLVQKWDSGPEHADNNPSTGQGKVIGRDLSPYERSCTVGLLTVRSAKAMRPMAAASGQNRSSRQPVQFQFRPSPRAPCRPPAAWDQHFASGMGPGRGCSTSTSVVRQAPPPGVSSRANAGPGCTRGFAPPRHGQGRQQLCLPNDHLQGRRMPLACVNSGRRWVRTTGPSLVRRIIPVAGRGWTRPGAQPASRDRGWT